MRFQMIGKAVEGPVDGQIIRDRRCLTEFAQKGGAEGIARKNAMQIGAPHAAIR